MLFTMLPDPSSALRQVFIRCHTTLTIGLKYCLFAEFKPLGDTVNPKLILYFLLQIAPSLILSPKIHMS